MPTFRADVVTLFGKYLPRHGVLCDVVGNASRDELQSLQGFASLRRPHFHAQRLRKDAAHLWLCVRSLLAANKHNCDAIQVRDMVSIGLLAMLVARIKGIPFVYWMSFLMCEGRMLRARAQIEAGGGWRARLILLKGKFEQVLLYRLVLGGARHVFVQSEAMKALVVTHRIAAGKISAVPMGVDTEVLDDDRAGQGPIGMGRAPLIGYLGTMDHFRRLDMMLDALLLVRRRHPDARLLLVGDSAVRTDVTDLLAYAAKLGLAGAVQVTGWLPSRQAWSLLRGVDAAISYIPRGPLYDVSSPTKLLEYLALGLPSVGNDSPDQVDVLTRSGAGWLVGNSAAEFAAALSEILDHTAAARLRAAAGPGFIESVRSYRVLAAALAGEYHAIAHASQRP